MSVVAALLLPIRYEAPPNRSAKASLDGSTARHLLAPALRRPRLQRSHRRSRQLCRRKPQQRLDVVEHGASLAIVATPEPGQLVLVQPISPSAGALLWEVPAGTAEPGEAAIAGARRELREETGYTAGRIRPIGSVWTTPGFCSEVMHFFHADGTTPRADLRSTTTSESRSAIFSIQAAWRLVAEGVADAKTVLALFWLQGGEDEIGSDFGR